MVKGKVDTDTFATISLVGAVLIYLSADSLSKILHADTSQVQFMVLIIAVAAFLYLVFKGS